MLGSSACRRSHLIPEESPSSDDLYAAPAIYSPTSASLYTPACATSTTSPLRTANPNPSPLMLALLAGTCSCRARRCGSGGVR